MVQDPERKDDIVDDSLETSANVNELGPLEALSISQTRDDSDILLSPSVNKLKIS